MKIFRLEIHKILYKLSIDMLVLTLVGSVGFMLAETILPGIFSQRIDFFFVDAWLVFVLGLVAAAGWATRGTLLQKDGADKRLGSWKSFAFLMIIIAIFLLPILQNVEGLFLVVLALVLGATITYLSRALLTEE